MSSEKAVSRREFLERLGIAGGSALMMAGLNAWGVPTASTAAAPPRLSGSGKGRRVVILGAGHAGQTAAFELSELGYECVVLEAREIVGGRAKTVRKGVTGQELGGQLQTCTFGDGDFFNLGPWRIPSTHRSVLHYTRLFQVPLEVLVNENDASYVFCEKGPFTATRIRQSRFKADLRGHTSELLAKAASTDKLSGLVQPGEVDGLMEYLVGEGHLSRGDFSYHGAEKPDFRVPPGAGTDPGPGVALDALRFGDLIGSKAWGGIQSIGGYKQDITMLAPVGGMDMLPLAFAKRIGHMIRLNCKVEQIKQDSRTVTVNYLETATGKRSTVTADYCVCTIPLSVLRGVYADFSPQFKEAMGGVSYTVIGKVGLQMKRRFWEEDDDIYGGHLYTDFEGINRISFPSNNWQARMGTLLGAYPIGDLAAELSSKTPADRIERALAVGARIWPDQYRQNFNGGYSWFWHLDPHSLGGWADWQPEGRQQAYPKLLEAQGRVYLAGEHLSYLTGWQAGAIESAWQQIEKLHVRAMSQASIL